LLLPVALLIPRTLISELDPIKQQSFLFFIHFTYYISIVSFIISGIIILLVIRGHLVLSKKEKNAQFQISKLNQEDAINYYNNYKDVEYKQTFTELFKNIVILGKPKCKHFLKDTIEEKFKITIE